MPMSTADVPGPSAKPAPESKPRQSTRTGFVPPPSEEPAAAVLAPASESSDAEVQNLLAVRQTAVDAGRTADAEAVTAQLAELGYR